MFKVTALSLVLFTVGCSQSESRVGQRITCEVDPDSGTIVRCEPGDHGGEGTCIDVDEDGDGHPDDGASPVLTRTIGDTDDEDGDGIPDSEDCDKTTGGDGDSAKLPYNFKMQLGKTYRPIIDAFTEEGDQPAEILSVTFDGGGSWRAAELQSGTAFTITQADCDHEGNKDVGRDRLNLLWRNDDGTTESDHMTLRYCDE